MSCEEEKATYLFAISPSLSTCLPCSHATRPAAAESRRRQISSIATSKQVAFWCIPESLQTRTNSVLLKRGPRLW
jgi:hypothetical protein